MTTPTPPPVKSSDEYFNSSRLKVIGLITAATVAVGSLGAIAGVVFDPEPVGVDNIVQPGDGGAAGLDPDEVGGAGSSGNSVAGRGKLPALTRTMPRAMSTSAPSPVGSVSPGTGGFSSSPTPSGGVTEPPEPTPTDNGNAGDGSGVTLNATGAQVFVPDGWNVDYYDDNQAYLSDGQNSFVFAFSYQDDPSVAAGDVISQNLEGLLPAENYTQLQTSDVVPLEPFGSLVSMAGIEYEALWVDNQGSLSIHGQIYVGVRQDGAVLGILVEHMPAEDFEASFDSMMPILQNSFGRFGGMG